MAELEFELGHVAINIDSFYYITFSKKKITQKHNLYVTCKDINALK
jgi:hypothetical protein